MHRMHSIYWVGMIFAITVLAFLSLHESLSVVPEESIRFPADAGIVDVTKSPYNATPNDDKDDTDAIQRALNDHPNANAIIYLPNGVYIVSDTLRWAAPSPGAACKRTILQGQSQNGTVIKLRDNCPGFSDPRKPKPVIWTGERPAQRFRNAIRNLTVDIGKGNAGAIGIQFIANNQGTLREVTIKSGDGQGVIGLDLSYTGEIGPCLIKNVRVIGFETGIRLAHAVNSVTMEHIFLEGQSRYGLENTGQCLSLRGLVSRNRVPAVVNTGVSVLALIDAVLEGIGEASQHSAIFNNAFLFARNVKVSGYKIAIENRAGHKQNHDGLFIEEFVSHPTLSLFPSQQKSLRLPILETPDVPWDDLSDWVSPTQFGADPTGKEDSTEAIQKAIDSGKSTVYFPRGTYRVDGTIFIRGKVRRIIGCEAKINSKGLWKFSDGESPVVVIERLEQPSGSGPDNFPIEHASSRTLVIRHSIIGRYSNTGKGDLFVEDVCGGPWEIRGQRVWARQLNQESPTMKILNDGGMVWILGLKTERPGTLIETRNGGKTELLGGFCYATGGPKTEPMFVINDASATFVIGESCFNNNPFMELVRETRRGEVRILKRGEAPERTGGSVLPLFVGGHPN
jgi:hypothetical protein